MRQQSLLLFRSLGEKYLQTRRIAAEPACATPVDVVNWELMDQIPRPAARSFGEMITIWTAMLEAGAWYFDQDAGTWGYENTRIPPNLSHSPLV